MDGAELGALERISKENLIFGAGNSHIAEPPLFFQIGRIKQCARMRQNPVFTSSQKNSGKFKAFSRM